MRRVVGKTWSLGLVLIWVALLLGISGPGIAAQSSEQHENLLVNSDFENGLYAWNQTRDGVSYRASTLSHSGNRSAEGIETYKYNLGRLYQDLTVNSIPEEQYKIGGWIKTQNVKGQVVIALDYVKSDGWCPLEGYVKEIGYVTGTTGWQYFESNWFVLPQMPSNCSMLWFLFDFNNGEGTAWFDDVFLVAQSTKEDGTSGVIKCDITGHYYELVRRIVNWEEAKTYAEGREFIDESTGKVYTGHLATLTSLEENSWVTENLVSSIREDMVEIWLGGYQKGGHDNPAEGWRWITGEAWEWTNWDEGEPNDFGGRDERYLEIYGAREGTQEHAGKWNDESIGGGSVVARDYILIEYEPALSGDEYEIAERYLPRLYQLAYDIEQGNGLIKVGYSVEEEEPHQIRVEYSFVFSDEDAPEPHLDEAYDFLREEVGIGTLIGSFPPDFEEVGKGRKEDIETLYLTIDTETEDIIEINFGENVDIPGSWAHEWNYIDPSLLLHNNIHDFCSRRRFVRGEISQFERDADGRLRLYVATWNHLFSKRKAKGLPGNIPDAWENATAAVQLVNKDRGMLETEYLKDTVLTDYVQETASILAAAAYEITRSAAGQVSRIAVSRAIFKAFIKSMLNSPGKLPILFKSPSAILGKAGSVLGPIFWVISLAEVEGGDKCNCLLEAPRTAIRVEYWDEDTESVRPAGGALIEFTTYGDGRGDEYADQQGEAVLQGSGICPVAGVTVLFGGRKKSVETNGRCKSYLKVLFLPGDDTLSGEITSFQIDTGQFKAGDDIRAFVELQNTGTDEHVFYIGYSVKDRNGKWWDAPYKSRRISPGQKGSTILAWRVDPFAPDGNYTARVAIWGGEGEGLLVDRYDYEEKEDAFTVVGALIKKVNFPDSNLEQAIRDAIDKPTGDIYQSDLLGLTELHADEREIVDLTGLEHCIGLTILYLRNNQISDISSLAGLTNLTELYLHDNQISNLSPLAALTKLTQLELISTQISDISPLAGLTNLTTLDLSWNEICGLSPLTGLVNLTSLRLGYNQISDISPLGGLRNLTELWLYGNQITSIQALVDNPGLGADDEISLQNNYLDLSPGSDDIEDIQELVDRDVEVKYKPQIKREEINVTETATSLYHLVFQLQGAIGLERTKQRKLIEQTIRVMQNRVNQYGLRFVEIRPVGTHQIEVTTPLLEYREVLRRLLGQTGDLRFCKVIEAGTDPNSGLVSTSPTQEVLKDSDGIPYIVEREPLLTGVTLSDARVHTSQAMQTAGQLYIMLTFNQEGAQRFVEALHKLKVNDRLAIVLDNVIYGAPRITQSIKNVAAQDWQKVRNSVTIHGKFTKDEATRIAIVLRAGALPVGVNVVKENILPEVP